MSVDFVAQCDIGGIAKTEARPLEISLRTDPQDSVHNHVEQPTVRDDQVARRWALEQALYGAPGS